MICAKNNACSWTMLININTISTTSISNHLIWKQRNISIKDFIYISFQTFAKIFLGNQSTNHIAGNRFQKKIFLSDLSNILAHWDLPPERDVNWTYIRRLLIRCPGRLLKVLLIYVLSPRGTRWIINRKVVIDYNYWIVQNRTLLFLFPSFISEVIIPMQISTSYHATIMDKIFWDKL